MDENNSVNFIERIINEDLKTNKNVVTRFPPEPNGYLHIGHAKSINLNFGIAKKYNGSCNLRFDDTNPEKEDLEYINSIIEDVKWLGFDWGDNLFYASLYFDKMYEFAKVLIKDGKAYVDDQSIDEIRKNRGTLTEAGINSPFRDRSVEDNLELFEKMKNGEFKNGEKVLRAKIDMASPNLNMRDPIMYRILNSEHPKTKDKWKIYPMYDWAHGLEDSLEGITHSLCTLEFEDHRPLYNWFLEQLESENIHRPQQIEFARLNLNYTVMSKRKLLQLVTEKYVNGWDDPRMPTISGLRRRGFTPNSIRTFCDKIGLSKVDSTVDYAFLESCLREDLNKNATRRMAVLKPLKLTITNYPDDKIEWLDGENNPEIENSGSRKIPFSKHLYIEQDDFKKESPNRKYFRFAPGKEVRLKHAYYVTCNDYKTDDDGNVTEIFCTYDPETKGGWSNDGRKVKGTSHWVCAENCLKAEVRIYRHLFKTEFPGKDSGNFIDDIDLNSLEILKECFVEPDLKNAKAGDNFQFLRLGYFTADLKDHTENSLVFNKTVGLRDTFTKKMN